MGTPAIWVIGDEGVGKASLIKALVGDPEKRVLHLDTKYYTATASITPVGLQTAPSEVQPPPEAVVLVVDASKQSSFLKVQQWWKSAVDSGMESRELGMLVVNKVDLLENGRSEWSEEIRDWALEEMMEVVDASATDPAVDSQLEDQGMQRIRAALEAHMWPGMKMKALAVRATGGSESGTFPPFHIGDERPARIEEAREDRRWASPDVNTDGWVCFSSGEDGEIVEKENSRGPELPHLADEELEALSDNFENLLTCVAGVREKVQHLPDAERRDAAANMAMRLATLMGDDESGLEDLEI